MFDKFGEFDSVEEMNKKADELKAAGDTEKICKTRISYGSCKSSS